MKRIIVFLFIIAQTQLFAEPTTGFLLQDIVDTGRMSRYTSRFYSDTAAYQNGGLTFVYPTDFWTFDINPTTPRITISIQLNFAPQPTETYCAVVSSNSPTSTTVLVYRIVDGGSVLEASSGEVNVTLLGIQDLSPLI